MPEISAAMQPKMYEDSHYPTYLRRSVPIRCERCEEPSGEYHVSAGARRFKDTLIKSAKLRGCEGCAGKE